MLLALHVHTDYSKCAESRISDIKKYCVENNIGAIAICDHNLIEGALELEKIAENFKVIIGEEIKTKQGEIIGLFLKNKIEPFGTLSDTIDKIKQQNGLVYLPHPFDIIRPFHMRWDTLFANMKKIDIVEIFNSKMICHFNNVQAKIFASQFNKIGAIGSDAHFVKAIGCAIMEIEDFDSPIDFLEKLKNAKIVSAVNMGVATTLWSRIKKFFRVRFRLVRIILFRIINKK
ncbi:MAG: PHP domain-containing protein [Armatimonadetes bacterium]|nr:PHP domain-containing protein [Candidatus Hippobium faecium]